MKIIKYPDGTSYADVSESEQHFTFKLNSYEDLWYLTQIVDAFNSTGQIPKITIPNLIDAQADRRFGYRQSSGFKLVCNHLNSLHARFSVFHPHNPEVVEALINNVEIIDNKQFISEVLNSIPEGEPPYGQHDDLILMPSDAGGFKPLSKLCDKLGWRGEMYSASKARSWEEEQESLLQTIYYMGNFDNITTLTKIRNKLC